MHGTVAVVGVKLNLYPNKVAHLGLGGSADLAMQVEPEIAIPYRHHVDPPRLLSGLPIDTYKHGEWFTPVRLNSGCPGRAHIHKGIDAENLDGGLEGDLWHALLLTSSLPKLCPGKVSGSEKFGPNQSFCPSIQNLKRRASFTKIASRLATPLLG